MTQQGNIYPTSFSNHPLQLVPPIDKTQLEVRRQRCLGDAVHSGQPPRAQSRVERVEGESGGQTKDPAQPVWAVCRIHPKQPALSKQEVSLLGSLIPGEA